MASLFLNEIVLSYLFQDKNDGPSEIKVWAPDKADVHGQPPCLRTLCPDPRPNQTGSRSSSGSNQAGKVPKVTALAVHPNLSLMAVGFQDGSVMLYRGEVYGFWTVGKTKL